MSHVFTSLVVRSLQAQGSWAFLRVVVMVGAGVGADARPRPRRDERRASLRTCLRHDRLSRLLPNAHPDAAECVARAPCAAHDAEGRARQGGGRRPGRAGRTASRHSARLRDRAATCQARRAGRGRPKPPPTSYPEKPASQETRRSSGSLVHSSLPEPPFARSRSPGPCATSMKSVAPSPKTRSLPTPPERSSTPDPP